VVALDVATGAKKWTFAAEGRVSIAPTYHKGLVLFGDHAGWVYCLEAAGGRLVWQLQAAPEQRGMSAFNQFESSWPVKSGVLALEEGAFFVAGRCGTMDGGLYLYGVDQASGQVRWKRNYNDIRPTDLLVSDGRTLFFGTTSVSPADGTDRKGAAAAPQERVLKSGPDSHGDISILDMLAASLDHGQTRDIKRLPNDGRAEGHMIAFDKDRSITAWRHRRVYGHEKDFVREDNGHCHVMSNGGKEWINKGTGRQMQAILLAGPRVYCAGIPEFRDSQDKPGLFVLSSADGKELQRILLDAAPSIDGLSAVGGKLIMTTVDGQVLCFGAGGP